MIHFSKWHGLGNDFMIINDLKETFPCDRQTASTMCDRHFGIGADGLVIILPSSIADFRMRIFNSDGSEGDMCGNASRCVALYLYENDLTHKTDITLETKSGIVKLKLILNNSFPTNVCVDLGEPKFTRWEVPMTGNHEEKSINLPLTVKNKDYYITGIFLGNPHCVIFSENIQAIDLPAIGPLIENHPIFPKKANVEFAQIIDRNTIKMRVWERGAGLTLACGTGASATLVASVLNGKANRQATLQLPSGDLWIEWADNNHVYMTGPACEVYKGYYILK